MVGPSPSTSLLPARNAARLGAKLAVAAAMLLAGCDLALYEKTDVLVIAPNSLSTLLARIVLNVSSDAEVSK